MSLLLRIFKIASKSTTGLRQDLVFDNVDIFIHYKMIYLDSIANKNKSEQNEKWPYIPWSSVQNFHNWWLWRYWQNLFVCKRFKQTKVWILIKKRENAGSALILWMMFRKILITTTQSEKEKFSLFWMTWLQTLWVTKTFRPQLKNCLLGVEK